MKYKGKILWGKHEFHGGEWLKIKESPTLKDVERRRVERWTVVVLNPGDHPLDETEPVTAAPKNEMRYCRVVFVKSGWPNLEIDFGYCDQEQKNAGIATLRKQYSDYSFRRCYTIPTPPAWASANRTKVTG